MTAVDRWRQLDYAPRQGRDQVLLRLRHSSGFSEVDKSLALYIPKRLDFLCLPRRFPLFSRALECGLQKVFLFGVYTNVARQNFHYFFPVWRFSVVSNLALANGWCGVGVRLGFIPGDIPVPCDLSGPHGAVLSNSGAR